MHHSANHRRWLPFKAANERRRFKSNQPSFGQSLQASLWQIHPAWPDWSWITARVNKLHLWPSHTCQGNELLLGLELRDISQKMLLAMGEMLIEIIRFLLSWLATEFENIIGSDVWPVWPLGVNCGTHHGWCPPYRSRSQEGPYSVTPCDPMWEINQSLAMWYVYRVCGAMEWSLHTLYYDGWKSKIQRSSVSASTEDTGGGHWRHRCSLVGWRRFEFEFKATNHSHSQAVPVDSAPPQTRFSL